MKKGRREKEMTVESEGGKEEQREGVIQCGREGGREGGREATRKQVCGQRCGERLVARVYV